MILTKKPLFPTPLCPPLKKIYIGSDITKSHKSKQGKCYKCCETWGNQELDHWVKGCLSPCK